MLLPNRELHELILIFFVFGLVLSSCRKEDGGVIRLKPTHFSAADESIIASRLLEENWQSANIFMLEPDAGSFTDGAYRYLTPLLDQLVDQPDVSRRDSLAWDLRLVLDERPHAYSLPGGKIIMHTGLLNALQNEAEYIGILAREVALSEIGASMACFQRQVDDNVLLGDILLGNEVELTEIIQEIPNLRYSLSEVEAADSLAALLVCQSDYEERGLTIAVHNLPEASQYTQARPTQRRWDINFDERVEDCPGADSLYTRRYREMLSRYMPR